MVAGVWIPFEAALRVCALLSVSGRAFGTRYGGFVEFGAGVGLPSARQTKLEETIRQYEDDAAFRARASEESHESMLHMFDTKMASLATRLEGMAGKETKLMQRLNEMSAQARAASFPLPRPTSGG